MRLLSNWYAAGQLVHHYTGNKEISPDVKKFLFFQHFIKKENRRRCYDEKSRKTSCFSYFIQASGFASSGWRLKANWNQNLAKLGYHRALLQIPNFHHLLRATEMIPSFANLGDLTGYGTFKNLCSLLPSTQYSNCCSTSLFVPKNNSTTSRHQPNKLHQQVSTSNKVCVANIIELNCRVAIRVHKWLSSCIS